MKRLTATLLLATTLLAGPSIASADGLNIVFTPHSSASSTFWQAVKKGFDDACGKVGANEAGFPLSLCENNCSCCR